MLSSFSISFTFCILVLDVNECSPNPCQNGGVCTDQVNGHKCTCVPGYTGTNCETSKCSL